MSKPYIVIGAGGHAGVVVNLLLANGEDVLFLTDENPDLHGTDLLDIPVKGSDDLIKTQMPDRVHLALGVGISGSDPVSASKQRWALAERYENLGYRFPPLVHPAATVGIQATIGAGAQIMAGAVLQPKCRIGVHAIVNTKASVDHDSVLGAGSHLGPGATLCGKVRTGTAAYIGAGATVVEDVTLADEVFLTAGSVLTRSALESGKYKGFPARAEINRTARK